MNFEEIAEKAYKKSGIDGFCDLPTKYAYLRLEELYNIYKIGKITKEDSIIEKAKIQREFENNKSQQNKYMDIYREYNQNKRDNSMLLIELEKNKRQR